MAWAFPVVMVAHRGGQDDLLATDSLTMNYLSPCYVQTHPGLQPLGAE